MEESHSFAAPIISGWILKFLQNNRSATYEDVLFELILSEHSKGCRGEKIRKKYKVTKYNVTTPVVGIYYSNSTILHSVKKIFLDNGYSIIVISEDSNGDYEIPSYLYLRKREKISKSFIFTLEKNYKADVIILNLYKSRYFVRNIWNCLDIILNQEGNIIRIKNSERNKGAIDISEVGNYILDYYSQKSD